MGQTLFEDPKVLSKFLDLKRRPQEFHQCLKIGLQHKKLLQAQEKSPEGDTKLPISMAKRDPGLLEGIRLDQSSFCIHLI